MFDKFHRIPLLILVVIAAVLAIALYAAGASFLAQPIKMGDTVIAKSIAALAKDSLFVPLKPLMYALIIMSIGSSLAISTGGLGAKFARVLTYFVGFSIVGAIIAVLGYSFSVAVFPNLSILPETYPSLLKFTAC